MLGITKDRLKDALGPLAPVVDAWLKFVDGFTWVLTRVVLVTTFFTIFFSLWPDSTGNKKRPYEPES